jgi:hypothetical protein
MPPPTIPCGERYVLLSVAIGNTPVPTTKATQASAVKYAPPPPSPTRIQEQVDGVGSTPWIQSPARNVASTLMSMGAAFNADTFRCVWRIENSPKVLTPSTHDGWWNLTTSAGETQFLLKHWPWTMHGIHTNVDGGGI